MLNSAMKQLHQSSTNNGIIVSNESRITKQNTTRTFLAASKSGLPSIPIEKVWMGYLIPISLAFLTNRDATKLESRPPVMLKTCYSR